MADIIKDDFIKRSDALDLAREYYTPALREEAVPVRAIRNIPSADVAPIKRGEWIEQEDGFGDTYYDCSCCGESFCLIEGTPTDNMYNFCPNCGSYNGGEHGT